MIFSHFNIFRSHLQPFLVHFIPPTTKHDLLNLRIKMLKLTRRTFHSFSAFVHIDFYRSRFSTRRRLYHYIE